MPKPGKVQKGPATKLVKVDSFFDFFSPPAIPDEGVDEEAMESLQEVRPFAAWTSTLWRSGFAVHALVSSQESVGSRNEGSLHCRRRAPSCLHPFLHHRAQRNKLETAAFASAVSQSF